MTARKYHHVVLALAGGMIMVHGCSGDEQLGVRSTSELGTPGRVRYSYDALGRLIQAAAADGTGVQYSYDPVGNITAIRRLATDTLSVVDFAPRTGPTGTPITVYGSGFDSTASNNTVTLNGTAAPVNSATATTLSVVVPVGATSGKIAVSNTRGSATSAADFVVSGVSSTPVIVAFTPTIAAVGTSVTVSGANFQSDARDDKVEIGGQPAQVVTDGSGPTQTQLKFIVPGATASGPIALTTPFGTAVSSTEFFAVPSTVNAGDVEFTGRLSADGPALTVTTTGAGKKAVLAFTGTVNQGLHLATQGGNFASAVTADVYNSDGTKIESLSLTNNGRADFIKLLARNGPYSVILSPSASDQGTVQISLIADSALAINDATAVSLPTGQSRRFILTTPANTPYGLALAGLSFTPSGGSVNVVVRRSDGAFIANCPFTAAGSCTFPASYFPRSEAYTVEFVPSAANAASFDAVLSTDATGTIPLDSPPTPITTVRPGQNALYTFSGTAGQLVTLVLTGNAIDDGNPSTNSSTAIAVSSPGGVIASTAIATVTASLTLDLTLPATGTYTVALDPSGPDFGTINAQIKSYVTGPLTMDGGTPVSLGAGQNARFTFTAQANTGYGLAVTGLTFTPTGGLLQATLRKADGTELTHCPFSASGSCSLPPSLFPTTGTYLVDFDPNALSTASFTAVLSTDTMGTFSLDSDPATVTIARPGQNARYSFAGTAGQLVTLVLTGNTLDDGNPSTNNFTQLALFKPSSLISGPFFTGSISSATPGVAVDLVLPETGTYALLIDPVRLDAGTINAQVKTYITGTLAQDTSLSLDLSAGRNARFTFAAEAGKGYGLLVPSVTLTPSAGAFLNLVVRKLDGTFLTQCMFVAPGSCDLGPSNFTTTGNYILDFDPNGLNAASVTAMMIGDVTGTLTFGGGPTSVTIPQPGQNARYSFAGTAGQVVNVIVSGSTLDDGNPATFNRTDVSVFKPSSQIFAITGGSFPTTSSGATLTVTLPETGNYTILVSPSGLDSGSFNLAVQ
jgi:YD repeat-containing protein